MANDNDPTMQDQDVIQGARSRRSGPPFMTDQQASARGSLGPLHPGLL